MTWVAVATGQMSQANSSLPVAGGALTVLLLPMTATLLAGSVPAEEPAVAPTTAEAPEPP